MAFSLQGVLGLNAGNFVSGMRSAQQATNSLIGGLNRGTNRLASFNDKLNRTKGSMGGAATATRGIASGIAKIGAAVGITKLAKDSIMLASDLTEVQNVVDTTFGKNGATSINKFANTAATKFGMSALQAKQFNGTLGAMMKSSGITGKKLIDMSTNLTGLSSDMASFYNLKPEEAFDKLRSAISGETKQLVPMLAIA
jgi:hypothetical protein